ncbi:MAG: 4Fe-4S dicluster domain-containing protein [Candidatus Lokiarchaeota archaeon]|nr:4Fe-4S dicluster domain-containing protein [Candidatus Lokiarchaeota archaeon]MBD3341101.1 4Fe-4S dicluster domain-containing protein [Candidatus Lokiarchaeota archaeon]
MSLPAKKTVKVDENITDYVYKMLSHEMVLRYDESKCIECGFCHRVCPVTTIKVEGKEKPLKRTAIGTPEEMGMESDQKIVVDTDKCIWCGSCTWICPGYTLELFINDEKKLLLVENGSLPEFQEEVRTLESGNEVRKVVEGSIKIKCTEKDEKVLDAFADECAVGALSREGEQIVADRDKCILCFKCTEAAKKYDNISVKVFRDRFKQVKGEPGSVWNGIMLRVLGKEGKIKGIMSRSQNKLADAVMRLMGEEVMGEEIGEEE